MKRGLGLLALGAVLAACSPEPARRAEADPQAPAGWARPPRIEAVQHAQASLIFSGSAEPGGRVVLRSDSGQAYAAAADARGRFDIRMTAPRGDLVLRPETQVGQDAAPSPDRLLILDGGRGPIAVLRAGGPTRRLDAAPLLGAVDSDGRLRLASGVHRGAGPLEVTAGGETLRVAPDAQGRWSVVLGPVGGPDEIRVGQGAFAWPGEGALSDTLRVERAGAGWRVAWSGPAGARQSTWLPEAAVR